MNVGKLFSELAVSKSYDTAIVFNEKQFTYGNLNAIANSLANYLSGVGIKQGDNVAVILPNCAEFAFVYFAVPSWELFLVRLIPGLAKRK